MNKQLNWIQRGVLKAIGVPVAGNFKPSRFQEVVMKTFGLTALWHGDGFTDNVHAYCSNVILYSIVNRVTKTAAIAPFKVYRVKPDKKAMHLRFKSWTGQNATPESIQKAMRIKSLVYEEDNSHPLNDLIERPNKDQKGNEFTVNSIGFKMLTGNRIWYRPILEAGADRGKPVDVVNLPPQLISVVPDGTLYGVTGYRFELDKNAEIIPSSDIVHSKYFNPLVDATGSHLMGMSPVRALRRNLTRSAAAEERSTATLQNAGSAGALIDKDGNDDTIEQASAKRETINRRVSGKDNSGAISLLNGNWEYINFGMTTGDMQVLEAEKISDRKICNAFGFPPGVFDPESATLNNSREFNKQILTGAVIPELSSLRDDWNEIAKLYKEDIYVDYDLSVYPELQEDFKSTVEALDKVWYLTGDEKRLMIGQDQSDDPMMQKYLIGGNVVLLDSLGEADINDLDDEVA